MSRLRPQEAERTAGDQVTLQVEGVADGGIAIALKAPKGPQILLDNTAHSPTSRLLENAPSAPTWSSGREREQPMVNKPIRISVWSDYVCPFCYLELPSLDRLKEEFGDEVTIAWRAFELRPDPVPTLDPNGEYLRRVWDQSVYPMAASRGMALRLPPVQPRSRKALEAAEFAREAGRFADMHEALFRAFFQNGLDLADTDTVAEIGASIGLDAEKLRQALDDGRFTGKVLADEREAEGIGIGGVPAMIMSDGELAFLLTGAQPYEELRRAVLHAQGRKRARR